MVSTTRPETVFGDVAVAVHPSDQRYGHLKNAMLTNPLNESLIPVVFDEAVNPECGTGERNATFLIKTSSILKAVKFMYRHRCCESYPWT